MDKGEAGAGGALGEGGLELIGSRQENQDPSTPVSRAGECAREPSLAQDDSLLFGGVDLLRRRFEVEQNDLLWIHACRLHGDAGAAGDGPVLDD